MADKPLFMKAANFTDLNLNLDIIRFDCPLHVLDVKLAFLILLKILKKSISKKN